jgi:hypothetical protein
MDLSRVVAQVFSGQHRYGATALSAEVYERTAMAPIVIIAFE